MTKLLDFQLHFHKWIRTNSSTSSAVGDSVWEVMYLGPSSLLPNALLQHPYSTGILWSLERCRAVLELPTQEILTSQLSQPVLCCNVKQKSQNWGLFQA